MHTEGGPPSARCPRDSPWAHGDRGFDGNGVDFLLFGVTTEEIRRLQSWVVVPRVTPPPPERRHLRQWARREPELSCQRARRPVDLRGHPPSLGSCVRRVGGVPCRPRRHSCRLQSARRGRAPLVLSVRRSSPLLFSLKIERRCVRRPVHKKQLHPVLVVWRHRARSVIRSSTLGCEFVQRCDPGHRVKGAQRRYLRGSAVAWRSRFGPPVSGPPASHEAF